MQSVGVLLPDMQKAVIGHDVTLNLQEVQSLGRVVFQRPLKVLNDLRQSLLEFQRRPDEPKEVRQGQQHQHSRDRHPMPV